MLTPGDDRRLFGDIGRGKLAEVFGGDHLDDGICVALDLDRLLGAGVDAGDDDVVKLGCRFIVCIFRVHGEPNACDDGRG